MPNAQPFCCPVCNGSGIVSRPPHITGDVTGWVSSGTESYPCRACSGSGIVWHLDGIVPTNPPQTYGNVKGTFADTSDGFKATNPVSEELRIAHESNARLMKEYERLYAVTVSHQPLGTTLADNAPLSPDKLRILVATQINNRTP